MKIELGDRVIMNNDEFGVETPHVGLKATICLITHNRFHCILCFDVRPEHCRHCGDGYSDSEYISGFNSIELRGDKCWVYPKHIIEKYATKII